MLLLCRLIPLSVVIYTVAGGLKATFTSSYLHTVRTCLGGSPLSTATASLTYGGSALRLPWRSPLPLLLIFEALSFAHRFCFQTGALIAVSSSCRLVAPWMSSAWVGVTNSLLYTFGKTCCPTCTQQQVAVRCAAVAVLS